MTTFEDLRAREAVTLQLVARKFHAAPDAWAYERAFWRTVETAGELAERRRATGRPSRIAFVLPSFGDLAPEAVPNEALVVLRALASLRDDVTFSEALRSLWGRLAADVANERDRTLARLHEPNPFAAAIVGGRTITEGPCQH